MPDLMCSRLAIICALPAITQIPYPIVQEIKVASPDMT